MDEKVKSRPFAELPKGERGVIILLEGMKVER